MPVIRAWMKSITRRESFRLLWIPVGANFASCLPGCEEGTSQDPLSSERAQGQAGAPPPAAVPPSASGSPQGGNSGNTFSTQPVNPPQPPVEVVSPVPDDGTSAGIADGGTSAGIADDGMLEDASVALDASSATDADAAGSGSGTNGSADMDLVDPTISADVPWASGGTGAMTGDYPDPFALDDGGAMCVLYPAQTIGPCYAETPAMRLDISDGQPGLPMRLSFQIVDANCQPVSGAEVDIWHTSYNGYYSAYALGTICNLSGPAAAAGEMFCRGVQVSDAAGRVDFNTIYPGWYLGRTTHVHIAVRPRSGRELIGQLYFADGLNDELNSQGPYATRGRSPISNQEDFVVAPDLLLFDRMTLQTARRNDGALHAWKRVSLG